MILENNTIDLKVGDVFRFNRARKHNKVINEFDYNGETYMVYIDDSRYPSMHTASKNRLCSVYNYYGNYVDAIVEVNGKQVRGLGGKLLDEPKPVTEKKVKVVKETKVSKPVGELTAFEKYCEVQKSGVINMTDIVTGARLAGISEEKYEDIIFNYDLYKRGERE